MLVLHDNQESGNAYKVRLILSQLHIPYQSITYDVTKGDTRTPQFLSQISSIGRIPVVEFEDGRTLAESNAILFYFAKNTSFLPEDSYLQAQVLQWLFFEQYCHEPYIAVAKYILTMLDPDTERRQEIPKLHKKGYEALDIMEQHLANEPFFVGGVYTIADICLFAYTHKAEMGEFKLSTYKNILAWIARVEAQEGFVPMM